MPSSARIFLIPKRFLFLVFLSLLVSSHCVTGNETRVSEVSINQFELHQKNPVTEKSAMTYYLSFFNPKTTEEHFPLLFIHHGAGEVPKNYLEKWKKDADERGIMLLIPERTKELGQSSLKPEGELFSLLNEIIQKYPIDANKIYITGASIGALYAKEILFAHPKTFRAAVFIASPADGDWNSKPPQDLPPVLFIHGQKDNQFPAERVTSLVHSLKESGFKAELLVHVDAGHEVKPEWGKEIFDWIEKQGAIPESRSSS